MKNQIADGKTLRFTASDNLTGGTFVRLMGKTGVTVDNVKSGCEGVLDMQGGVYEFTASAALGSAAVQGAAIYAGSGVLATTGNDFTLTSGSGCAQFGYLEESLTSDAKTGKIRLC